MEQADNPVLPAAATAQPVAMQLAPERMERRLLEERMERRLDAERAARKLQAAQAESEKKILEERMARKQLKKNLRNMSNDEIHRNKAAVTFVPCAVCR